VSLNVSFVERDGLRIEVEQDGDWWRARVVAEPPLVTDEPERDRMVRPSLPWAYHRRPLAVLDAALALWAQSRWGIEQHRGFA
jgi:hypothetical protein